MMSSVDGFKITVHGKGAHGAYPNSSIDPINIAVHIYLINVLGSRSATMAKSSDALAATPGTGVSPGISWR